MGRDLKDEAPLTKRISLRLTEDDYKKYINILSSASVDGKTYTASDFIRDSIFNRPITIIETNPIVRVKPNECERNRLRMLSLTTSNINQIAKALNTLIKYGDADFDLFSCLVQINDIHTYVKQELC